MGRGWVCEGRNKRGGGEKKREEKEGEGKNGRRGRIRMGRERRRGKGERLFGITCRTKRC